MNIALPALVVFVLLLPGFIARARLKRIEKQSLDYSPFGQLVTEALVWAAGLHMLWIAAMEWLGPYELEADIVLKLLGADAAAQARALEVVAAQAASITCYFASLIAFAYLAPLAIRTLISSGRLDRADARFSSLLRFSAAPWYYLLSGADFKKDEAPDFIAISAIVNIAGQPFLYMGVLDDYFLDQEGMLDRLVLEHVMRRPLEKDKSSPSYDQELDRFYPVDGDYFVLRYSEAITLNVEYIKLQLQLEPS
jgi:hypothetical protein